MKAKKIWANFSVKNAQLTRQFYNKLGFKSNGLNNDPKFASFLFSEDELVIHFFEQGSKIDEFLTLGSAGEIIFTLAADTEAEVNKWAERVEGAGGTIFQPVGRDENGYYGFAFGDPDGHRFNVLLMDNM